MASSSKFHLHYSHDAGTHLNLAENLYSMPENFLEPVLRLFLQLHSELLPRTPSHRRLRLVHIFHILTFTAQAWRKEGLHESTKPYKDEPHRTT
jgi:hypothetical protein